MEDWGTNLYFITAREDSVALGADLFAGRSRLQVHPGFLTYGRTLEAQMKAFSMHRLASVLALWGCVPPVRSVNFHDWLVFSSWSNCTVVGHSLGGALATIAATDLAVRSGRAPLLVTFSAPAAGNEAFEELQNKVVAPAGGLRVVNLGDALPVLGYSGVATSTMAHGGRQVCLLGRKRDLCNSCHLHLRYTVPSTPCCSVETSAKESSMFRITYKPSATHDHLEDHFGDYWA
mmetsp:Transcript_86203/g.224752  ORF Transcript_86203/g.224752 Transcript_86203/m.224752 type:complete len:233 (+) Transcript_86203:410-1108(+)